MKDRGYAGRRDLDPRMRGRRRGSSVQALVYASGLVAAVTLGGGVLFSIDKPSVPIVNLSAKPTDVVLVRRQAALQRAALFDPALTGYEAIPFARSAPLRSRFERPEPPQVVIEAALEAGGLPVAGDTAPQIIPSIAVPALVRDMPLPIARPGRANAGAARPVAAPSTRYALREQAPASVAPPTDGRTLLERMFGAPTPPAAASSALAYATPGETGGGFFGSREPASSGTGTAIYNIARHTVTLPDGTTLEAHSGLGVNLDNPGSITQHMRGATPPSLYDLSQREALFHGVRALRLTPLLAGTTFGRGGLLAHTFMLGPRGDSNGCVVFRDYSAFLGAYDSGKIRRLLVVAGT